jgi:pyruvate-formate lyase
VTWWKRFQRSKVSTADPQPIEEAEEAVRRAQEATQEASEHLKEMRVIGEKLRTERQENHFGPDIYRAMTQRKHRES